MGLLTADGGGVGTPSSCTGPHGSSPCRPTAPAVTPPDRWADGRVVLPVADGPAPSPAGLAAQLTPLVTAGPLGQDVAGEVTDVTSGRVLWSDRSDVGQVPASTVKILTAAAALQRLGPDHRLVTRTVWWGGRVVLVGGGDPTLTVGGGTGGAPGTSLQDLAERTAAALHTAGRTRVRLAVDDSLFAGPAVNPAWEDDYVSTGVVAPVGALAVHTAQRAAARGPGDPARRAGAVFAGLLRSRGVRVEGPVTAARATAGAAELARVESATVARLVEHTLDVSDNEAAEALLRLVGAAHGGPGTVAAGTAAVRAVLVGLKVPVTGLRLVDGSGLARSNRVSPATLTGVLTAAASPAHPRLRPIVTGMPVAGLSGTLAHRLPGPAAGVVRAKTGTLTGVAGLAGLVVDADGALLTFAVLADQVPPSATLSARGALDRFAVRLAGCGCPAPPARSVT
jgi:D-alanyl-D-alanine carboxypeptidase/D-alanyl-D-alanine-endopeptidase (penicillin-binding protein 4)